MIESKTNLGTKKNLSLSTRLYGSRAMWIGGRSMSVVRAISLWTVTGGEVRLKDGDIVTYVGCTVGTRISEVCFGPDAVLFRIFEHAGGRLYTCNRTIEGYIK